MLSVGCVYIRSIFARNICRSVIDVCADVTKEGHVIADRTMYSAVTRYINNTNRPIHPVTALFLLSFLFIYKRSFKKYSRYYVLFVCCLYHLIQ